MRNDDLSTVTAKQARRQALQLAEAIDKYRQQYYLRNQSQLSDAEYDKLEQQLAELLTRHPQALNEAENPLIKVGTGVETTGFQRHQHKLAMLSLNKVNDNGGLIAYTNSITRFLNCEQFPAVTLEPKLDGVSASLTYQRGKLTLALTRGDGSSGEDITANVLTIANVPANLGNKQTVPPKFIEIRGEVIIAKPDFAQINEQLAASDEKTYLSTRNYASGSLRQINPAITAARKLKFIAYGIGAVTEDYQYEHQHQLIEQLQQWGFATPQPFVIAKTVAAIEQQFQLLLQQQASSDIEADGMVCKIAAVALQQRLGNDGHAPRWAVAYKFPAELTVTTVTNIRAQISRLGVLTPLAELEPVQIANVTIARASLHNWKNIVDKDIRIGDSVALQRAGGVIPYISHVITEKRPDSAKRFQPPTSCPECGHALVASENQIRLFCTLRLACPGQRYKWMIHVVSRDALDLPGLGDETIQQFSQLGWLQYPADIFLLPQYAEQIRQLAGWGDKSWQALQQSINAARQQSLDRALYSLGIANVGKRLSRQLADIFSTYQQFRSYIDQHLANVAPPASGQPLDDRLVMVDGIGTTHVQSLLDYFADSTRAAQADRLVQQLTIANRATAASAVESSLRGKSVLFTGKMTSSRREMKTRAEQNQLKIASGISRNLDYLVVGEKPAPNKVKKAEQLGLQIYSEAEWQQLLNSS